MDRVLFQMPDDPREFFMSMSVVQAYVYDYLRGIAGGTRHKDYQFVYRLNEKYSKFEPPLKVAADNFPIYDYSGWKVFSRSEFQCFIDFDFNRAMGIALSSGVSIIDSLGVLYGCKPRKWPILPPPKCTQGKGIIIVDWDHIESARFQTDLGDRNSHIVDADSDVLELEVETAEAVIGPVSAITYLAAAYNKRVIEIFPDQDTYFLYNNDGLYSYQPIIGHPKSDDVFQAWSVLEQESEYAQQILGA